MVEPLEHIMARVDQKLGILIALQMTEEKPKNIREKVKLLDDFGANTADIAAILNITPSHAAKEKSLLKKNGPKTI